MLIVIFNQLITHEQLQVIYSGIFSAFVASNTFYNVVISEQLCLAEIFVLSSMILHRGH
jgi:hypothetical protein